MVAHAQDRANVLITWSVGQALVQRECYGDMAELMTEAEVLKYAEESAAAYEELKYNIEKAVERIALDYTSCEFTAEQREGLGMGLDYINERIPELKDE